MQRLIAVAKVCLPNSDQIGCISVPDVNPVFATPEGLILGVANKLIEFSWILAVIAIVWSGVLYITSAGDESKMKMAKQNLIWAITGLVVFLVAILIIKWVQSILEGSIT